MPEEPVDRALARYIAAGAAEGAMSAAEQLSEALGVGLSEVLTALRDLRTGEGPVAVAGPVAGARVPAIAGTVTVSGSDGAAATESPTVVRHGDVSEMSVQASRGGLAWLSANQWVLAAVVLIAIISFRRFPRGAGTNPG